MYLQLGWRNIWRNPRRTTVIVTAVVIGVWSMIFLGALMRGVADQMVRNGIATLTGHIQIHQMGYRSDPVIENSIEAPETAEHALTGLLPPNARWTARVRVNGVVSNARHSDGITFVGIDPAREAEVSFVKPAIVEGRYLAEKDEYGIVIGQALAEKFETQIGRKLVVMSQDTNEEIASRAFRIVGIFRAEMEAIETQFVFVTLPAAQQMLSLHQGISEISILLPSREQGDRVAESLRKAMPAELEVHTWQQLLPMVTAVLTMYDSF
ncbi:MAG: ABC transporter permease, partial [Desulforhabdus sp.]|nr:ABC transporter permease [Desulforhabdus sp.]